MRRPIAGIAVALAVLLSVVSTAGAAAEPERTTGGEGGRYHLNMMELFLGNTFEDAPDGHESGFSVGLAYERRISELLGVGGFYEDAAGELDKWSVGAPLLVHPYRGWRLTLAPGVEHRGDEDAFLFRTGVAYEVELAERWALIPEFNVDFVDGQQSYVLGVSIGLGF